MQRRQFVTAVGTSALPLAGCVGTASSGEGSADTPTVSVESVDEHPPRARVEVSVVRQFSRDRPAKVEVAYTSTADSNREVDFQASPPFSEYLSAGQQSPRLAVIPDDHSHVAPVDVRSGSERAGSTTERDPGADRLVPRTPVDGCWRVPTAFAVYGAAHPQTLSSGETVAEEYAVLGHAANEACLPPGTYRFEQDPYAGRREPWGFALRIERA